MEGVQWDGSYTFAALSQNQRTRKMIRKFAAFATMAALMVACSSNSGETMENKVDETIDATNEAATDAMNAVEGTMDAAGAAVDSVGAAASGAVDAAAGAVDAATDAANTVKEEAAKVAGH
jgi:hypothetical protein